MASTNLHKTLFLKNAQRCQGGTRRNIVAEGPIIRNLQKNIVQTSMHTLGLNLRTNMIDGTVLEKIPEEKDLGVIITDTLSPSSHCARAVKTANQVLGIIKRTYQY